MTGGHHRAIARERRRAFAVQLLVGQQVEGVALGLEPGEQMGVGLEMAQARAARLGDRDVAGPQRD
jgi:hypothetical protein